MFCQGHAVARSLPSGVFQGSFLSAAILCPHVHKWPFDFLLQDHFFSSLAWLIHASSIQSVVQPGSLGVMLLFVFPYSCINKA